MPTRYLSGMTLHKFNSLPYERQLAAVFDTGIFLARRWEEEGGITLYHLPGGVFVEVNYDVYASRIMLLQSFTSAALLEVYTLSIELPGDL
jgi:hypothetical protein